MSSEQPSLYSYWDDQASSGASNSSEQQQQQQDQSQQQQPQHLQAQYFQQSQHFPLDMAFGQQQQSDDVFQTLMMNPPSSSSAYSASGDASGDNDSGGGGQNQQAVLQLQQNLMLMLQQQQEQSVMTDASAGSNDRRRSLSQQHQQKKNDLKAAHASMVSKQDGNDEDKRQSNSFEDGRQDPQDLMSQYRHLFGAPLEEQQAQQSSGAGNRSSRKHSSSSLPTDRVSPSSSRLFAIGAMVQPLSSNKPPPMIDPSSSNDGYNNKKGPEISALSLGMSESSSDFMMKLFQDESGNIPGSQRQHQQNPYGGNMYSKQQQPVAVTSAQGIMVRLEGKDIISSFFSQGLHRILTFSFFLALSLIFSPAVERPQPYSNSNSKSNKTSTNSEASPHSSNFSYSN